MITCWLRMADTGDFPTCEESYTKHIDLFDTVFPINGGKLQSDGTWKLEPWKLKGFGKRLPVMAKAHNQEYMPVVTDQYGAMPEFLSKPELYQQAADDLITMMEDWDGVVLDFEKDLSEDTRDALSQFYYLLSYEIRKAGKTCVISVRGHDGKGNDYPSAYGHDFSVVNQCADYVDYRLYGHWKPLPRTRAPYYWMIDSLNYAFDYISPDKILLGSGTFSNYFTDKKIEISYQDAMKLSDDIQWIEEDENGTVRESYSEAKNGHIWIADYHTTLRDRKIMDGYSLAGLSLFTPSGASEGCFRVLQ